jgi:PAS domain S-box-containing protein
MAGPDTPRTFFNKPWLEFTGRAMAQELGNGWTEGVHREDFQRCRDTYLAAFHAREPFVMDYRLRRADGEYRWVLDRGVPRFDLDGTFAGYIGSCVDIADQKRAEEERTQLLRREQHARQEAEAANRAKDEFLATLSHELRTPLSAILGWAQVMSGPRRDEATLAQAIESIERNARLQVQLIEDLLDLSRIVAGKVRLESRTVDLGPLILAAVDTVRPTAQAKDIKLIAYVEAGTSTILGDPDRLQQVCWNLLSNAVKFTPRHGRVEIRLDRTDSRAQIRVIDNGQGIVPDMLPFIFDRFQQADSGLSRAQGGLGLGLAIVRHLVELHGGTVQAASAGVGQGATFTVSFPLLPVRMADVVVMPERGLDAFASAPRCDGLLVLVVDDEPDARALLTRFLEQCGATVTAVGSVAEALALLDHGRFSVIVSDLALPGEDGFVLARRVRERPSDRGGRSPLLALTAHAGASVRVQAIVAGFDSYIAKPVDPAELAAVVVQLASRA